MLGNDKKRYNIVLEKQIKEKIDELAQLEYRSSSSLINFILKNYIENYEKEETE